MLAAWQLYAVEPTHAHTDRQYHAPFKYIIHHYYNSANTYTTRLTSPTLTHACANDSTLSTYMHTTQPRTHAHAAIDCNAHTAGTGSQAYTVSYTRHQQHMICSATHNFHDIVYGPHALCMWTVAGARIHNDIYIDRYKRTAYTCCLLYTSDAADD